MGDYIVLGIVVVVLITVIIYIIRQKKKGVKCIGCQHSSGCNKCNCGCDSKTQAD